MLVTCWPHAHLVCSCSLADGSFLGGMAGEGVWLGRSGHSSRQTQLAQPQLQGGGVTWETTPQTTPTCLSSSSSSMSMLSFKYSSLMFRTTSSITCLYRLVCTYMWIWITCMYTAGFLHKGGQKDYLNIFRGAKL